MYVFNECRSNRVLVQLGLDTSACMYVCMLCVSTNLPEAAGDADFLLYVIVLLESSLSVFMES